MSKAKRVLLDERMEFNTDIYIEKLKAAALANRDPKNGEKNFRCEEIADGSRPHCNPGLCCGGTSRPGEEDTYIEVC